MLYAFDKEVKSENVLDGVSACGGGGVRRVWFIGGCRDGIRMQRVMGAAIDATPA
jgi:hypothetical protein